MWISKNDFNGLKDQFNNLSDKIDEHRETIFELQRIIEHYIPGKITYVTSKKVEAKTYGGGTVIIDPFTCFYQDGKEYQINGLYLHDLVAIETKGCNEKVLYIKESYKLENETQYTTEEYVVDLQNQTFIRTK